MMIDWIARANEHLASLRALLAPYGLAPSPALRVIADTHPCPGYVDETETIQLCPPEIASPVDRLRWSLFIRVMGCDSLDEARGFYEVALPFIVAHETAHHLRIRRGLDAGSPFIEEQACDRIAAACVDALPELRATLPELQRRCARMRARLAESFAHHPTSAFVPDAIELAVHEPAAQARWSALRRLGAAREEHAEQWFALLPEAEHLAEAKAERARAGGHLDLHYTRDPSEYWYASVVWLERYLASDDRPRLIEALNSHLASERDGDAERLLALCDTLLSDDEVLIEGAASGLLERWGGAIAHDLVDRALEHPRALAPITRALLRAERLPADAVGRLLRADTAGAADPPRVAALIRLAARSGLRDEALLSRARALAVGSPALRDELAVFAGAADEDLAEALCDPARAGALLDALDAQRRTLGSIPSALLPRRGGERWEQLLRLAARAGRPENALEALRAAAFAADLGPADLEDLEDAGAALSRAAWQVATLGEGMLAARPEHGGPTETNARAFARAALTQLARRHGLEIVTALVPASARAAAARIAALVERAAELEPALVELLVDHVREDDLRDRVRALLCGQRRDGAAELPASALPPVLSLAVHDRGYPGDADVRTLLDKLIHLRSVPLFAGLSPEQLGELAALSIERRHAAGDLIVREGDRGDELHLVLEGEVSIERSGVVVAEVAPPGFFGEMSLFDGAPRSATAVARTACLLLSLDGQAVRQAGRRDPAIFEAFLAEFSRRMRLQPVVRDRGR